MQNFKYYKSNISRVLIFSILGLILNGCSKSGDTIVPPSLPGAPLSVLSVAGNGQATVTFSAPNNNGGAAITGYTVVSTPGNYSSTGLKSPIVITGLNNGTTYTFTVTATNSAGIGSASVASNAVVPAVNISTPGAPTNITAVAGNSLGIVSFTTPTVVGSAPITSYIVTSSPGNLTATGFVSPITISGLTNGVSYTFTVNAINSAGAGTASAASNAISPLATIPTSNKTCSIFSINQYNNGTKSSYAMSISFDYVNRPVKMVLYDSVRKVKDYEASFVYQSDAIVIDQYQSFKIDPTTQQVKAFKTKSDLAEPKSDDYLYEYIYNDSGYLIRKNQYINGSVNPIYKTTYNYDNKNVLIGCLMVVASNSAKILESTITYETTQQVKSFMYTFPDGFESYIYAPILNYGKKMRYPVKSMITKVYDPSAQKLLDTWTSSFGAYTYSVDGYVVQGIQTGDLQQGFALFYGKTIFTYLCQ